MMEKLLNTVTGRKAARDIEFLRQFARRTADPDPDSRGPACELVRIAYEDDAYDGPGVHVRTSGQQAFLLKTWSTLPLHRYTPEVRKAMHGAFMSYFGHNSPLAASFAYLPFISTDLDMTTSHLRMAGDLATGNLEQLLATLRRHELGGIEVRFESTNGKLRLDEIVVDRHPEKLRHPAPALDGIRHLSRDPDDGTWSTRPWKTSDRELGQLLKELSLDLLLVEHPRWFDADREARVHIDGDTFWLTFDPDPREEAGPATPAGLPQP